MARVKAGTKFTVEEIREAPDGSDTPGEKRIPAAAANVPDPGFGGMAA